MLTILFIICYKIETTKFIDFICEGNIFSIFPKSFFTEIEYHISFIQLNHQQRLQINCKLYIKINKYKNYQKLVLIY